MMGGRGEKGRVEREEAAAERGIEVQGSRPDRQLKTKFGDRLHLTRNEKGGLIPQSLRAPLHSLDVEEQLLVALSSVNETELAFRGGEV